MKKGLLSILAGALVVVGCQNYDDQFDNLNSQINALASTVAGLSQVQSDLASLSGTVASLASTVNGLGSQIDTAVSNGLADIQADIDAIEAAVADVASSEAVDALSDAVAASQEDLEELLANSSVFQGDVIINSPSTLEAYKSMGSTLAIVNGYVDIDVSSDMNIADVQTVVDQILVTTEDFSYTAGTDVDTEVTFNNLTGTQTLTLDQEGGYELKALESATVITLDDDSTVDIVHLGALTTVTSINSGSVHFTSADELHLTSLPRYGTTLSLEVDKGGVIAMPALRDVDAAGDQEGLALTIKGPASISITELDGEDGSITLEDVETAVINSYDGTVTINEGVENFSSDNLIGLEFGSGADDLVTFNVTGALDPNDDDDEEGPAITLSSQGDLETATISGDVASVTVSSNGNLTDLTIDADVEGAISVSSNSDLTTLTLTGSEATGVTITSNGDLESVTVDTTFSANADDDIDGSLTVTSNESLTSLTVTSNNIEDLNVSSNADLETIDFTGVDAVGATAEPTVNIQGNDLTASKATDLEDGDDADDDVGAGEAGDLGSFTTTSGMDTLADYLAAVVAVSADASATVVFDTVDTFINEDEDDLGEKTSGDFVTVLKLTPKIVTTEAVDATYNKIAIALDTTQDAFQISVTASVGLLTAAIDLDPNDEIAIDQILSDANLSRADAYDVTLNAYEGAFPTGSINFRNTAASNTDDVYNLGAAGASYADFEVASTALVNLTIDGVLLSSTLGGASGATYANAGELVARIDALWDAKYGQAAGTSKTYSLFNVDQGSGSSSSTLEIKAKNGSGSRGFDKSYSISITTASATLSSAVFSAYYGATTDSSDNKTISNGIIVTVEATSAGTVLDETSGFTFADAGAVTDVSGTINVLETSLRAVAETGTTTTDNIYPEDARGDVVVAEGGIDEVATAATTFDRTSWLD